MSSLPRIEDDSGGWDLSAVVRSCRRVNSPPPPAATPTPPAIPPWETVMFQPHHADPMDTRKPVHELEELCKPYISATQQPKFHLSPRPSSPGSAAPRSQLPRSKRRKNQQKKMVSQVVADGLAGDMWAWRKYGQKPIKGSPFPRGYYRCSSSKGCIARKQVERSRTDQGMFVITYTGEHNHPLPTHRNSLAGSTRQKFPAAGEEGVGLSPKTPLTAGIRKKKKPEGSTDEEEEDEEELDMLSVEDMEVVGDDGVMFMGFEELQSSMSPVEDELFVWEDERRQTGWPPAAAD